MDLNAIYTELILEHIQHSGNKGSLKCANCRERGYNPSCGDDITLEFCFKNGKMWKSFKHFNPCSLLSIKVSTAKSMYSSKYSNTWDSSLDWYPILGKFKVTYARLPVLKQS